MTNLTRFDTNALRALNRSLVGFDRVFDAFDRAQLAANTTNYPPYNIVRVAEDQYQIEIAVAGFVLEEVDVSVDQNKLTIRGERKREDDASHEYLHRGLAMRDFEHSFTLADHIVVNDASIKDGILVIRLERQVPEALKPRRIAIRN